MSTIPYHFDADRLTDGATLYYYDRQSVDPDRIDLTILPMTVETDDDTFYLRHESSDLALVLSKQDARDHMSKPVEARVLFADFEEALAHKLHDESHRLAAVRTLTPETMLNELYTAWKTSTRSSRHEQDVYAQTIQDLFGVDPR